MAGKGRTGLLPRITGWKAYGRMFTRPRVWRRAVAHVLARHGLETGPIRATVPGGSAVFAVGSRWIVKFSPPMLARDQPVEVAALQAVAGRRGLPAPRLVAHGVLRDRTRWPYLVIEPVVGRQIGEVWPRLRPANRRSVARELGRFLRALHRVPAPRAGRLVRSPRAWARHRVRLITAALRLYRDRRVFDPAFLRALAPRLVRLTALPRGVRLRFIHADITHNHPILARRRGRWRLAGVIDFADAERGDPIYEWSPIWNVALRRDVGAARALLAVYRPGAGPRWRDRAAAWMLVQRFAPEYLAMWLTRKGAGPVPRTWDTLRDTLVPPALEG